MWNGLSSSSSGVGAGHLGIRRFLVQSLPPPSKVSRGVREQDTSPLLLPRRLLFPCMVGSAADVWMGYCVPPIKLNMKWPRLEKLYINVFNLWPSVSKLSPEDLDKDLFYFCLKHPIFSLFTRSNPVLLIPEGVQKILTPWILCEYSIFSFSNIMKRCRPAIE